MTDSFGREINYLRISVTENCNLRCAYCMRENAVPREWDALSDDEIVEVASAAAELGMSKIRITGGEPLLRPGIAGLCARISAIPGVEELAVTTNGTRLAGMARELRDAGVKRVNISLDTLDPEKYKRITRGGDISRVISGVDAAFACALTPIKLNTVLIGGFNDDEIFKLAELTRSCPLEVRFIELMPIGDVPPFPAGAYMSCAEVLKKVPELIRMEDGPNSVARLYRLPDGRGRVGLISPLSDCFCQSCSRLRLTADGCLKPCLHSAEEIHLRGLHGAELQWALKLAIAHKPRQHGELSDTARSASRRNMNRIGG
jgi:cyclic pyranopterin phosphate synthase